MTTKTSLIYLLLIGVIGFSACKKQETNPPPAQELPRQLVKITYSGSPNNPILFKYDEKGRLVESGNSYGVNKFFYTNNVFSATLSDQNNYVFYEIKNGKLDNAGRILDFDGVYHQPNQPDTYYKDHFEYNPSGYLVKFSHANLSTGNVSQDDYMYSNGNMTSDINTYNGQPNYHTEYTYYDSLENKLSLDFQEGIINFFTDGLTGKRSRNLRKTEQNFTAQNVKNIDYLFSYVMDAQGYPAVFHIKSLLQNFDGEKTMEYNK